MLLTLQYSTQWDSFAHVGGKFDADGDGKPEIVFYNGFRAGRGHRARRRRSRTPSPGRSFEGSRAEALGIQNLAEHGAQGRGVMIDLHAHFGRERKAIGYDELMRVMDKDKVVVEKGDIVCFYTGFVDVILELKKNPDPEAAAQHLHRPGRPRREAAASGSRDCGCAALIADNYAVEIIPASPFKPMPHALHAAARALPVQERHPPGRDLVPHRARALAARAQAQPLPAHRAAAAPARRGRLARRRRSATV